MNKILSDSPSDFYFSRGDIDRIVSETFVDRVDYHSELASTNSRALQLAGDEPDNKSCTLVLADHQAEGRGRGANRWWSADGALTFSLLLRPDTVQLPISRWPQGSLTTALSICDAIESLRGNITLALKWPNDVYLQDRKLCGILVEGTHGVQNSLVVGIGINVNNSVCEAPPELRETAIALCDLEIEPIRRIDVLVAVLQRLAVGFDWLGSGHVGLRENWRKRCMLTNRHVLIELPRGRMAGVCRGIDDDGALILETTSGTERCMSGVIVQFN